MYARDATRILRGGRIQVESTEALSIAALKVTCDGDPIGLLIYRGEGQFFACRPGWCDTTDRRHGAALRRLLMSHDKAIFERRGDVFITHEREPTT